MTREAYETAKGGHSQDADSHTQALHRDLHSTGRTETRAAWNRMSHSTNDAQSADLEFDAGKLPNYTKPVLKNGHYQEYHFNKKEWPTAQSAMSAAFLSSDPRAVDWARDMANPKTRGRALSDSDPNKAAGLSAAAHSSDAQVRDWALAHMDKSSRQAFLEERSRKDASKRESEAKSAHSDKPSATEIGRDSGRALGRNSHGQSPNSVERTPNSGANHRDAETVVTEGDERPSGSRLVRELDELADYEDRLKAPKRQKPVMTDSNGYVIDLPQSETNYRHLSKMVPNESMYTEGGIRCADKAYTAGVTIWPFDRVGVLFTEANENCELAQTVETACLLPEVLAMDSAHARTAEEARRISKSVITATKFCTETIDAATREKKRLQAEKLAEEREDADEDEENTED